MRTFTRPILVALLMIAALVGAPPGAAGATGGPVVLTGIDAEDCGVGGHGPIANYVTLVNSILSNTSNGGNGILVIGANGAGPQGWWNAIGTGTGEAVTFGAPDANFAGFQMVGVTSVDDQTCSGLTNAQNATLAGRPQDFADFVNNGGGLLANTQAGDPMAWQFVGGFGGVTVSNFDYTDIDPTAAGLAAGVTNALDLCCWHNVFNTWPSFLEVLAFPAGNTTQAAALGGQDVVLGIQTTKTADDAGPVNPSTANGYTIQLSNPNTSDVTIDSITDTLPPGFMYTPGSTTGATTSNPAITPDPLGDALVWSGPFNLPGSGNLMLSFDVTVSPLPGTYFNVAGGTATNAAVASTGPTAQIIVAGPGGGPTCNGLVATIVGVGNLVINGTPGNDVIVGTGIAERINGGSGADLICAGDGDDRINPGKGGDTVFGEGGNDVVYASAGPDWLDGGPGIDRMWGGPGLNRMFGGPHSDMLAGGPNKDIMDGGPGDDALTGGKGPDELTGGLGFDWCNGGPGANTIDPSCETP